MALAANGPNIVANSSFEFNSERGLLPDGWRFSRSVGNSSYGVDQTQSYTGSSSLMMKNNQPTDRASWISEKIYLKTSTKVQFGLHYKTIGLQNEDGKFRVILRRYDGGGSVYWEDFYTVDCDNDNNWISFTSLPKTLGETVSVDLNISITNGAGTLYIDDIWMCVVDAEEDLIPPKAPDGVVASRQAQDQIILNWNISAAASDGDLPVMYKIFRSKNGDILPTEDNLVGELFRDRYSWLDYNVEEGTRYYYMIAAMDKAGKFSFSKVVSASERPGYIGDAIENGGFEEWESATKPKYWTIEGREGSITRDNLVKKEGNYSLKITNLANTEYNSALQICSIKPNTDYTLLGWIKGENIEIRPEGGEGAKLFMPLGAAKYYGTFDWKQIKIKFNSGSRTTLEISPYLHFSKGTVWFDGIALCEAIDGSPPEAPTMFKASRINRTNKVELTWNPSNEAPDGDLPTRYLIFSGEKPESLTLVTTLPASATSWIDTNAPPNSDFCYVIIAEDKAGNESYPVETFVSKMGVLKGRIISEMDSEPLEGVKLFLDGIDTGVLSGSEGNFEIDMLLAGYYTLSIITKYYQKKGISFELTIGELKDLGDIELSWDDIPPKEPGGLRADGRSHVGLIDLVWSEPEKAEDEEIASSYNIYRSTSENVLRIQDFWIANTEDTSWRDIMDGSIYGKTLYYVIEAVDGAGNVSEETSNTAWATVRTPPIPVLDSPRERMLFYEEDPKFYWGEISDQDLAGFIIQLSTNINFPIGKTLEDSCDNVTNYTWPEELEQGIWFWRIRSCFNTGVLSSWSKPEEFVLVKLEPKTALVPYINVVPSILSNEFVNINYLLTDEATVMLNVFNIGGKLVDTIIVGQQGAGYYECRWEGKNKQCKELPNGLYIIHLKVQPTNASSERVIKKLVIYR